MKLKALLIDFGATRIKSAILDLENGAIVSLRDWEMFNVAPNSPERYEIPTEWLTCIFCDVCNHYYNNAHTRFQSVFLCSQMHGFIVADDKNVPQTNYISWRDHRSQVPDAYGQTSFELLQHALAKHLPRQTFRAITGMRLRPSLPIANFFDWVRENRPNGPLRLLTIPDWLACCSNRATGIAHTSMLAGLGFWNIRTQECDIQLISLFKETFGVVPLLNKAAQTNDVAGFWVAGEQSIPIYVGVGDHQCALLGADNQKNSLSFNIGTGSQVSRIIQTLDDNEDSEVENRPFFGKEFFAHNHTYSRGTCFGSFRKPSPKPTSRNAR